MIRPNIEPNREIERAGLLKIYEKLKDEGFYYYDGLRSLTNNKFYIIMDDYSLYQCTFCYHREYISFSELRHVEGKGYIIKGIGIKEETVEGLCSLFIKLIPRFKREALLLQISYLENVPIRFYVDKIDFSVYLFRQN